MLSSRAALHTQQTPGSTSLLDVSQAPLTTLLNVSQRARAVSSPSLQADALKAWTCTVYNACNLLSCFMPALCCLPAGQLISESHRKLAGIDDVFDDINDFFRGVGRNIRRRILQVCVPSKDTLWHWDWHTSVSRLEVILPRTPHVKFWVHIAQVSRLEPCCLAQLCCLRHPVCVKSRIAQYCYSTA